MKKKALLSSVLVIALCLCPLEKIDMTVMQEVKGAIGNYTFHRFLS